jgi:hypothetical protein
MDSAQESSTDSARDSHCSESRSAANELEAGLKQGETQRYYPHILALARVMKEDLISGAKGKTSISLTSGKPGEQMDCGAEEDVLFVRRLSPQAHIPSKGSCRSAGVDIYSAYAYRVPAQGKVLVMTDLQVFRCSNSLYLPTKISGAVSTWNLRTYCWQIRTCCEK